MEKLVVSLVFIYGCLAMTLVSGTLENKDDQWLHKLYHAREKITHLKFYVQDVAAGPNLTVLTVAQPPKSFKSPTGFGTVNVIDDIFTEGPEPTSKIMGRAQGMATYIGKDKIAFLLSINFVFASGEFKGSNLTMVGRNAPYLPVREMPIVGGTGVFRLARGFVMTKTHQYNPNTTNGVYEYNVVAIHH